MRTALGSRGGRAGSRRAGGSRRRGASSGRRPIAGRRRTTARRWRAGASARAGRPRRDAAPRATLRCRSCAGSGTRSAWTACRSLSGGRTTRLCRTGLRRTRLCRTHLRRPRHRAVLWWRRMITGRWCGRSRRRDGRRRRPLPGRRHRSTRTGVAVGVRTVPGGARIRSRPRAVVGGHCSKLPFPQDRCSVAGRADADRSLTRARQDRHGIRTPRNPRRHRR